MQSNQQIKLTGQLMGLIWLIAIVVIASEISAWENSPTSPTSTTPKPKLQVAKASSVRRLKSVQLIEPPLEANKTKGKRQVDQSTSSLRRNEDPWFLDHSPQPLQPYKFAYDVKGANGLSEQYRQEVGDGQFLTGSYGYVLPDGIYRHVDYVADDHGFRAFIRTSEPGTANQNPSNVVINANPVISGPANIQFVKPEYGNLLNSAYVQPVIATRPASSVSSSSDFSALKAEIELSRLRSQSVNTNLNLNRFNVSDYVSLPTSTTTPAPSYGTGSESTGDLISRFNAIRNFNYLLNNSNNFSLPQPSFGSIKPTLQFNQIQLEPSWQRVNSNSQQQQQPKVNLNTKTNNWRLNSFASSQAQKPLAVEERQPIDQDVAGLRSPSASFLGFPTVGSYQAPRRPLIDPLASGSRRSGTSAFKLLYDRPLSVQGSISERNKHTYDNKHLYHPETPLLSIERSRGLGLLGSFNSLARGSDYLRPGELLLPSRSPFESSPGRSSNLATRDKYAQTDGPEKLENIGSNNDDSSHSSSRFNGSSLILTSEFEFNSHRNHNQQQERQPELAGQSFDTKSSVSSGHHQSDHHNDHANQGTKGGGSGQASGRLRAPYTQYAASHFRSLETSADDLESGKQANFRESPVDELLSSSTPTTPNSTPPTSASTHANSELSTTTQQPVDQPEQMSTRSQQSAVEMEIKQLESNRRTSRASISNLGDTMGTNWQLSALELRSLTPNASQRQVTRTMPPSANDMKTRYHRLSQLALPRPPRMEASTNEIQSDQLANKQKVLAKLPFSEINSNVKYDEDVTTVAPSFVSENKYHKFERQTLDRGQVYVKPTKREMFTYSPPVENNQPNNNRKRAVIIRQTTPSDIEFELPDDMKRLLPPLDSSKRSNNIDTLAKPQAEGHGFFEVVSRSNS